ncbi:MAG: metal-dependent transcriptional regulator [Anaerolineaceae bacterium]|nr:metal-dependent transcriptional regulator [Anaerolineaceae bacterium]
MVRANIIPQEKRSESAEMYLETLLLLEQKSSKVRQVDLAKALGYKRSTVHISLKSLQANGWVTFADETFLRLTDQGRLLASEVYARHQLFAKFLQSIGVNDSVAQQDACKIEHVVSAETVEQLKAFCSKIFDH